MSFSKQPLSQKSRILFAAKGMQLNDLDRNLPVNGGIVSPIDNPHRPAANDFRDPVTAELLLRLFVLLQETLGVAMRAEQALDVP
jgi:hypothetical protein